MKVVAIIFGLMLSLLTYAAQAQKPAAVLPGSIKNSFTVQSDSNLGGRYGFGTPQILANSGYTYLPLFQKETASTLLTNYLVINTETGKSALLFEMPNQVIVQKLDLYNSVETFSPMPIPAEVGKSDIRMVQRMVNGVVLVIVKEDSNHDGVLSASDQTTLAYAKPDGSGYTEFLEKVEGINAISQVADNRFMIVFTHPSGVFMNLYATDTFRLIEQKNLKTNFRQ